MKHIKFRNKLLWPFFHPAVWTRTFITVFYLGLGVFANFFMMQVFCVPVWWASAFCLLGTAGLIVHPFINHRRLRLTTSFLLGVLIPVSLYCILFLSDAWSTGLGYILYVIGIVAFGLGLLAFIPFYILYHVYRYWRMGDRLERRFIIAGAAVPLVCLCIYLVLFQYNFDKMQSAYRVDKRKEYFLSHIPKNHFSERVLGIGFKYHTRLEFIYDGWRPPLHDPFLNIGLLLFSDTHYPFELHNRIDYYHQLFPEQPVKVDCPCSYMSDGKSYFNADWDRAFKVQR